MYAYVYCIFLCTFTGDAPLYACQPLGGYMCMRDKFLIPSTHSLTYMLSLSLFFFSCCLLLCLFFYHTSTSLSPPLLVHPHILLLSDHYLLLLPSSVWSLPSLMFPPLPSTFFFLFLSFFTSFQSKDFKSTYKTWILLTRSRNRGDVSCMQFSGLIILVIINYEDRIANRQGQHFALWRTSVKKTPRPTQDNINSKRNSNTILGAILRCGRIRQGRVKGSSNKKK